jgi:hypothetical protein
MRPRHLAALPFPLIAALSGCYGPCSTPILLAPLGWIANPQQQSPTVAPPNSADRPPDGEANPGAPATDIRDHADRH